MERHADPWHNCERTHTHRPPRSQLCGACHVHTDGPMSMPQAAALADVSTGGTDRDDATAAVIFLQSVALNISTT